MATRRKPAVSLKAVQPSCQQCTHWKRHDSDTKIVHEIGQCMLNPPQVIAADDPEFGLALPMSCYPETAFDERCGQFKPLN